MCAALIGGMDRLHHDYIDTARRQGVDLKCFTGKEKKIGAKIGQADLIIVLTGKVSHEARREAAKAAKSRDIPLVMVHSSGVSTLRDCLKEASAA